MLLIDIKQNPIFKQEDNAPFSYYLWLAPSILNIKRSNNLGVV